MAVVDSSVLIHLARINKLQLLKEFFPKEAKIRITQEVFEEVKEGRGASEIQAACQNWIEVSKQLPEQRGETDKLSKSEDIEKADASLILLAQKNNDVLVCNDYALITIAKSKGIDCWRLTGFLMRCLGKKLISKEEAKQILLKLIESGMRLSNEVYSAVLNEIDML